MVGMALSCGPDAIYRCYDEGSIEELMAELDLYPGETQPPFFASYLTYPLSKLFEERDFRGAFEDTTHWTSILDDVVGIYDPCTRHAFSRSGATT